MLLLTLKKLKMTRIIIYTVAFLFSIVASAQVCENRTVGSFSKVKVSEENSKIELFQSGFPNEMVILETIK